MVSLDVGRHEMEARPEAEWTLDHHTDFRISRWSLTITVGSHIFWVQSLNSRPGR